jgi:hypothetical protein
MVDTKAFLRIWLKDLTFVALISFALFQFGRLFNYIEADFLNPIGILTIAIGISAVMSGQLKLYYPWKEWIVLSGSICLIAFAGTISNVNFVDIWKWWAVCTIIFSIYLTQDSIRGVIFRVFPDHKTGVVLISTLIAMMSLWLF